MKNSKEKQSILNSVTKSSLSPTFQVQMTFLLSQFYRGWSRIGRMTSITVTDACAGANVIVEYLLFLDLNQDGIQETVINSEQLGGTGLGWNNVRYDNLNTPNFLGGTPRAFDSRPVPSNQKMGFALQKTVSGNEATYSVAWNTQQVPIGYLAPELPHGTHRIKWFLTDLFPKVPYSSYLKQYQVGKI